LKDREKVFLNGIGFVLFGSSKAKTFQAGKSPQICSFLLIETKPTFLNLPINFDQPSLKPH